MKKITMKKGDFIYELLLQNYKIVIGSNEVVKYELLKIFRQLCINQKPSSYAVEYGLIPEIMVDETVVSNKNSTMFYVHKNYSLSEDLKLGTKSLISKYLDKLFGIDEFKDTISTINLLFDSLRDELHDFSSVECEFNSINAKQLLKLTAANVVCDDLFKDEYDMSIEEIIIFQLDLIKFIVDHSFASINLVCVEINYLSKIILDKIKSLKNCEIILFVNGYCGGIPIETFALCENIYIDVANEEMLYLKICDNNYRLLSLEEGRDYMRNYIYRTDDEKQRFITKIIK